MPGCDTQALKRPVGDLVSAGLIGQFRDLLQALDFGKLCPLHQFAAG